jgi:H+-transporting ATPase
MTIRILKLLSSHPNPFLKFLSYFQGPVLYVMELAVLLAAGLRDWIDFGVIVSSIIYCQLREGRINAAR